jgi:LMBR1 domain-containing protein 1
MDIFLIIILSVLAVILFIANIYIFFYYIHPDDNSNCSNFFSKFIVIAAMMLCWIQVLLLPLDVANARGGGVGLRMDIAWTVIFILIAVFAIIILPFISAYNDCEEEWSFWEKMKHSICYFIISMIVFLACLFITYALLSNAEIPITKNYCGIANLQKSSIIRLNIENCTKEESQIYIKVSLPIYVIALITFLSSFLFSIFGGIGLAALPFDCIFTFTSRPKIL